MDMQIKITASKPQEDLDEYLVNLFIERGRTKRLGTIYLGTEQDALQLSRIVTAIPEIMNALEHWKGMSEARETNAENTQVLYKLLNEKLERAYNKATDEVQD